MHNRKVSVTMVAVIIQGSTRSRPAMLNWASILYGAALSAVVAGVALAALARPRQLTVILTGVLATAGGPLAWNAILRATHASQFFTDAPLRLLPASWQDTGSGVFALAGTAVLLGGAAGRRPGPAHGCAGRALRPGRVPGRRLPVLTNLALMVVIRAVAVVTEPLGAEACRYAERVGCPPVASWLVQPPGLLC